MKEIVKLLKMLKKLLSAPSLVTKEKMKLKSSQKDAFLTLKMALLTDVFPGIDIQNDILDQMNIPQIKL